MSKIIAASHGCPCDIIIVINDIYMAQVHTSQCN